MIRNVILDWSGTLVNDLPIVWHACNTVFRKANVPELSLERFRDEIELPIAGFYRRYVAHVAETDLQQWFFEGFLERQDEIVPLPNAESFLRFCREQGMKTLVLTAVPEPLFRRQVTRFGWHELLDATYLGVVDKRLQIGELLSSHRLDIRETLFVGDMQHDVETARHAGIRSAAVLTGYDTLPQLRASGPDWIVEHLAELQRLLLSERNGRAGDSESSGANPEREERPVATVGALIRNSRGQLLMIRTNKWSNKWGIPGGKIDWGETCEQALRREILEETGLTIRNIEWVLVQDAIAPPEFYRKAHFLLLNYLCDVEGSEEVQLNAEGQEFRWVDWEDVWSLPLNAPTRLLLQTVLDRNQAREKTTVKEPAPGASSPFVGKS